jgi:transcriptional regulator with XRE-family HTH domain
MDSKKIGAFISALRKEHSMTQQNLADQLKVTNKAVSKWETGEGYPEITIIPALAEILGVTTDELLRGERKAAEEKPSTINKNSQSTAQGEYLLNNSLMRFKNFNLLSLGLTLLGVIAFFTITLSTYYEIIGFGVHLTLLVASGILFMVTYNSIRNACNKFGKLYPDSQEHLQCIINANKALVTLMWVWACSILLILPYVFFDDRTFTKSIITFGTYINTLPIVLIVGGVLAGILISYVKSRILLEDNITNNGTKEKWKGYINKLTILSGLYCVVFFWITIIVANRYYKYDMITALLIFSAGILGFVVLNGIFIRKCRGKVSSKLLTAYIVRNLVIGFSILYGLGNNIYTYSDFNGNIEIGIQGDRMGTFLVFMALVIMGLSLIIKQIEQKNQKAIT